MEKDPTTFRKRWMEVYQGNMDEHPERQDETLAMLQAIEDADFEQRRAVFDNFDKMLAGEVEKVLAFKRRREEILRPHLLGLLNELDKK